MSLILDALNRSRQDTEQMPGLASVHPVEEVRSETSWLLWLMIATLALSVLAIAWLLLDRRPQAPPSAPVEQAQSAATAAGQAAGQSSAATRSPPQAPPPAAIAKSQSDPGPKPKPALETVPVSSARADSTPGTPAGALKAGPSVAMPPKVTPKPAEPEAAPVDEGVAALYQQRQQSRTDTRSAQRAAPVKPVTASRVEEALDLEQLVAQAEAELEDARIAEHEVPMLSMMSQQTKDTIPTLMYQQHDYAGDPARSSVIINGKTLRAGQAAGGVKVEEVLPDSVVLEVRGTRFRLRALNSWVNL